MKYTQVAMAPSGNWFADCQGWGRKFGRGPDGEAAARKYAASFEADDDSER